MQPSRKGWRTVLSGVLAFGGLLVAIGIGRPSWLNVPPPQISRPLPRSARNSSRSTPVPVSEPILGFLDMRDGKPTLFAKQDSQLQVSGWTACSVPGSTLIRVTLLVNNQERGDVKDFFSRPDVAAAFGRPDFENSGWRATISLAGLRPGVHTLTAQGIGSHGEKGKLPAFQLNILE